MADETQDIPNPQQVKASMSLISERAAELNHMARVLGETYGVVGDPCMHSSSGPTFILTKVHDRWCAGVVLADDVAMVTSVRLDWKAAFLEVAKVFFEHYMAKCRRIAARAQKLVESTADAESWVRK